MTYSQSGQDQFVLSLFYEGYKGVFVDIGCEYPKLINNTLLLEENGWMGISLDILDFSEEWKIRNTPFICADALMCDFNKLFIQYNLPRIIDYLSLDIEGEGERYLALKRVIECEYEFKVITVEHDVYRGYELSERMPQRKLLTERGYSLLYPDVISDTGVVFEDWWINPKYITR
jgi:hypothetical protein